LAQAFWRKLLWLSLPEPAHVLSMAGRGVSPAAAAAMRRSGQGGYAPPGGEGGEGDIMGGPEAGAQFPAVFENSACLGGGVCCLVVLGVLGALSIGAVPPLFSGVRYNTFTKSADIKHIYPPGRHLILPWNSFLLFPSNVQTIEFTSEPKLPSSGKRYEPLHTRTKEGLGLHLQVSLQYRLIKEKIGSLYNEFNMNYETVFISSLRDTLIKAASEYEATQLWTERKQFGDNMQSMVDKELRSMYAECWGLQLMIIDLPDVYESSIVHTQVQKQQVSTRQKEQESTQIRAQTTVIMAEFDKKVKVIKASGIANFTFTTKSAEAMAQRQRIDVESEILGLVKKDLGLPPADLVAYQRYGALDDLENANVLFGFGSGAGGAKAMIQTSLMEG